MSGQAPVPQKKRYIWDYARNGKGAKLFAPITHRFFPSAETLKKQIEAEKLKQELLKLKRKTPADSRVAA
jgi:hypothetical protein